MTISNRMVAVCMSVVFLGLACPRFSHASTPDPLNCTWGSTVAVSPKNRTAMVNFRYQFTGTLRDASGAPIAAFPANQLMLDFSLCGEPSTRLQDNIRADGDSDINGTVKWSLNLNFGGADPCGARVLVQNIVFKILRPHQGLPNVNLDGGLRSPDENGDGVISLADLAIFREEFVNMGPLRFDYRGDIGQPAGQFDGITSLVDLSFFQAHFVAP